MLYASLGAFTGAGAAADAAEGGDTTGGGGRGADSMHDAAVTQHRRTMHMWHGAKGRVTNRRCVQGPILMTETGLPVLRVFSGPER